MAEDEKMIDPSGNMSELPGLENVDLSEAASVPEEQVKLVSELSGVIDTAKPEGVPYIEIETAGFLLAAKIFMQKKASVSDILSRAALFSFSEKRGSIAMTDGLLRTYAEFEFLSKTVDFPLDLVVDIETLFKVAQVQGKKFYLVFRNNQLFVDFYGGQIYIPTYTIKTEVLKHIPVVAEKSFDFSTDKFLASLQIAAVYSCSVGIPDLSFVFYEKDALYLANGYSVMKIKGEYCDMSIRKHDLPILIYALQLSLRQSLKVDFASDRLSFKSPVVDLQIPRVQTAMSQDFKKLVSDNIEGGYNVDFARMLTVLSIFERIPQSSGVVFFKVKDGVLVASSKTRDGKDSFVELSSSKEGEGSFDFYISIKNVISVLRSLRPSSLLRFVIKGDFAYIIVGEKTICLFGKGS